jgi:FMN-dependent NADH-azoreductase
MTRKILGIVGSYRKNGIIDSLVSEALASAQEHGAETEKIYLIDSHIEFCTNCRTCTQEPGPEPGTCIHNDDMTDILARYLEADGVVIGAPVNCFNVNAVTRKFMERLTRFAYWPWGQPGPKMREKSRVKKAVLITSTAMPAFAGRFFTGALRALRLTARTLGAKPIASIFVGMIAQQEKAKPSYKALRKAREAGRKLAIG